MPLHVSEAGRHITLVTIDNQAKRNAMSRATLGDLAAVWDRLEASAACRCVVITGAGEKAFCAGADIGGDLTASAETALIVSRALLKTTPFSKPIVAAVNGDCAGGGVELLLSTDIRIAADQARFGLPEVRWSIYPFGGATVKLMQQIGYVHAMDLLLTGRLVSAEFAAGIGLVNRVLPAKDVLPAALEVAAQIAANSPSAVQAVKTQISASIADFAAGREALEQQLGDRVRASPHFAEGVAAFREKRRPNYA
jgi:enoyl-CoA hydratase/carnithine racemase